MILFQTGWLESLSGSTQRIEYTKNSFLLNFQAPFENSLLEHFQLILKFDLKTPLGTGIGIAQNSHIA